MDQPPVFLFFSEHSAHRGLEQDCPIIQMHGRRGWADRNLNSSLLKQHNMVVKLLLSLYTGMLSHQLKQHTIDGEKTIIQNPTDQQRSG